MTLIRPQAIPSPASLGRLHFIAMGGAGMSGVAAGYLARGMTVSGCDQADSDTLRHLATAGAVVSVGHDPAHIAGADTVVVSSAIRPDNPEVLEAGRRGVPVIHRSLALASLMTGCRVTAVAGTHGKTTTTAMCVAVLEAAHRDPSYVIGGTLLASGLGSHMGTGADFVVEADESDGSFLQYPTTVAVVTNIEADHLDNWGTVEHYAQGFEEFAAGETVSTVIVDIDDPGAARLAGSLGRFGHPVVTYGESDRADVRLTELALGPGTASAVLRTGDWAAPLTLAVPGVHNLHNAAAALCVAETIGADRGDVLAGLAGFRGTARRFQIVGSARGVTVVDDYAHHPTEVAATIRAARSLAGAGRVIVCFQPHLFTRTRDFADAFGAVLAQADEAVVLDVYPAREDPIPGVTGELVADAVRAHGGSVRYVPQLEDAADALACQSSPGDVVLTVGAGSVTQVAPRLLAALEAG